MRKRSKCRAQRRGEKKDSREKQCNVRVVLEEGIGKKTCTRREEIVKGHGEKAKHIEPLNNS